MVILILFKINPIKLLSYFLKYDYINPVYTKSYLYSLDETSEIISINIYKSIERYNFKIELIIIFCVSFK